jgi:tetratricopeptide (TPR) repeat protein
LPDFGAPPSPLTLGRGQAVRWATRTAAAAALAGLFWAGGGSTGWQASAAVHLLSLAGLLGAGLSLLARAGFLESLRPGRFVVSSTGAADASRTGRISSAAGTALLLLLSILLASSLLSEHPGISLRRLGAWLCLAGWTYLLARHAGRVGHLRRLTAWLAAFGAGGCAAALLMMLHLRASAPATPFLNPNHVGALAAAALPLLGVLWATGGRGRWVWAALAVPTLSAALLCRSTAALGALVAGALPLLAGWAAARRGRRPDLFAGPVAAALILAALVAPVLMGRSDLAERGGMAGVAQTLAPGGPGGKTARLHWERLRALVEGRPDVSVAGRLRYARATLRALREEPFLGFGPGSVPVTFARYRLQVPGAAPWGEAVGQLHSVGLQRVYEGGFAGLAAFAAWVLLSVLGRPDADPARSRLRAGLAAAAAALAAAGAADALETAPTLVAIGMVLLALLAARPEARATERMPRAALAAAGAVGLLFALAAGVDLARADAAHRRAQDAVQEVLNRNEFDDAVLDNLRAAARLDGSVGLYRQQAAYAAEELALNRRQRGDVEGARPLFEEAESLYRGAAERFPDVPGFATQAGNFLLDRDRPHEAVPYLQRGLALDYYDPLAQFYLGEAYRLSGREEEAIDAHARAIRYYPPLARARLWGERANFDLRRRVLERVRRLLLEESSRRQPGTAGADLLFEVDRLLREVPAAAADPARTEVLVHRFDQIPGLSRARHLFERSGFTMENLPVAVRQADEPGGDRRWARVLEGLPVLTAVDLEARQASAKGQSSEDRSGKARQAGRRRQRAGIVIPDQPGWARAAGRNTSGVAS